MIPTTIAAIIVLAAYLAFACFVGRILRGPQILPVRDERCSGDGEAQFFPGFGLDFHSHPTRTKEQHYHG